MKNNIFITGFMGTGKSTVSDVLSKKMNKSLIDTDEIVKSRTGKSINEIFTGYGEAYFRRMEKQVLREVVKKNNQVIATGGGTLLDEENYQLALKNGIVILLQASPEMIHIRLKDESSRPLLSGENKIERIINLMNERKAKYSRFKYFVDTTHLTVNQVVEEVIQICRRENDENNPNKH